MTMCPGGYPIKESQNWQNAFLPGKYQATYIDSSGERIEQLIDNIRSTGVAPTDQRQQLDLLRQLNRQHAESRPDDQRLESRIESFELAYRMQSEAAEAFDITRETETDASKCTAREPLRRQALDRSAAGRARCPVRTAVHRCRSTLGQP